MNDKTPQIIEGSKLLRAKTGNRPGPDSNQVVMHAEAAPDDMSDQNEGRIRNYIETINTAMSQALASVPPSPDAISQIRKIAKEIKGQGLSLGYPLLTQVGHMLYSFIDRDDLCAGRNLNLIAAHIDFMNLVVQLNLRGDGGPQEEQLLAALYKAAHKLSNT